jgi:hypothetical protein
MVRRWTSIGVSLARRSRGPAAGHRAGPEETHGDADHEGDREGRIEARRERRALAARHEPDPQAAEWPRAIMGTARQNAATPTISGESASASQPSTTTSIQRAVPAQSPVSQSSR